VRSRLSPRRPRPSPWPWIRYGLGRFLQVTGLVVALFAATAFFGTPSTIAMLQMMLVGVLLFLPGWLLARKDPRA
jgi:drug/metabolite transporter (DMT)-like permease